MPGIRNILMTADTVGGVWTYALDLCRELAADGIGVSLATMGALPSDEQRRQIAELPNVTLHESRFKLEWMPEPWEDLRRAVDWLLKIAERVRPDREFRRRVEEICGAESFEVLQN